jgi:spoIIIJ-associated protein
MSETRATLEVIAPTIDEAIEKGLVELGLPPNAVEVEVLDEGSRGLLGIGSRQARVRLSIKPQAIPEPEEEMAVTLPETTSEAETLEEVEQQPEAQPKPDDDRPLVVARETIIELLEKMKIQAEVDAYYGEPRFKKSYPTAR